MNPRCPTAVLTSTESQRLRDLVRLKGETAAVRIVGVSRETLYKAASECPVSRLSADVIRGRLDSI